VVEQALRFPSGTGAFWFMNCYLTLRSARDVCQTTCCQTPSAHLRGWRSTKQCPPGVLLRVNTSGGLQEER
jgi:hypothetical protein